MFRQHPDTMEAALNQTPSSKSTVPMNRQLQINIPSSPDATSCSAAGIPISRVIRSLPSDGVSPGKKMVSFEFSDHVPDMDFQQIVLKMTEAAKQHGDDGSDVVTPPIFKLQDIPKSKIKRERSTTCHSSPQTAALSPLHQHQHHIHHHNQQQQQHQQQQQEQKLQQQMHHQQQLLHQQEQQILEQQQQQKMQTQRHHELQLLQQQQQLHYYHHQQQKQPSQQRRQTPERSHPPMKPQHSNNIRNFQNTTVSRASSPLAHFTHPNISMIENTNPSNLITSFHHNHEQNIHPIDSNNQTQSPRYSQNQLTTNNLSPFKHGNLQTDHLINQHHTPPNTRPFSPINRTNQIRNTHSPLRHNQFQNDDLIQFHDEHQFQNPTYSHPHPNHNHPQPLTSDKLSTPKNSSPMRQHVTIHQEKVRPLQACSPFKITPPQEINNIKHPPKLASPAKLDAQSRYHQDGKFIALDVSSPYKNQHTHSPSIMPSSQPLCQIDSYENNKMHHSPLRIEHNVKISQGSSSPINAHQNQSMGSYINDSHPYTSPTCSPAKNQQQQTKVQRHKQIPQINHQFLHNQSPQSINNSITPEISLQLHHQRQRDLERANPSFSTENTARNDIAFTPSIPNHNTKHELPSTNQMMRNSSTIKPLKLPPNTVEESTYQNDTKRTLPPIENQFHLASSSAQQPNSPKRRKQNVTTSNFSPSKNAFIPNPNKHNIMSSHQQTQNPITKQSHSPRNIKNKSQTSSIVLTDIPSLPTDITRKPHSIPAPHIQPEEDPVFVYPETLSEIGRGQDEVDGAEDMMMDFDDNPSDNDDDDYENHPQSHPNSHLQNFRHKTFPNFQPTPDRRLTLPHNTLEHSSNPSTRRFSPLPQSNLPQGGDYSSPMKQGDYRNYDHFNDRVQFCGQLQSEYHDHEETGSHMRPGHNPSHSHLRTHQNPHTQQQQDVFPNQTHYHHHQQQEQHNHQHQYIEHHHQEHFQDEHLLRHQQRHQQQQLPYQHPQHLPPQHQHHQHLQQPHHHHQQQHQQQQKLVFQDHPDSIHHTPPRRIESSRKPPNTTSSISSRATTGRNTISIEPEEILDIGEDEIVLDRDEDDEQSFGNATDHYRSRNVRGPRQQPSNDWNNNLDSPNKVMTKASTDAIFIDPQDLPDSSMSCDDESLTGSDVDNYDDVTVSRGDFIPEEITHSSRQRHTWDRYDETDGSARPTLTPKHIFKIEDSNNFHQVKNPSPMMHGHPRKDAHTKSRRQGDDDEIHGRSSPSRKLYSQNTEKTSKTRKSSPAEICVKHSGQLSVESSFYSPSEQQKHRQAHSDQMDTNSAQAQKPKRIGRVCETIDVIEICNSGDEENETINFAGKDVSVTSPKILNVTSAIKQVTVTEKRMNRSPQLLLPTTENPQKSTALYYVTNDTRLKSNFHSPKAPEINALSPKRIHNVSNLSRQNIFATGNINTGQNDKVADYDDDKDEVDGFGDNEKDKNNTKFPTTSKDKGNTDTHANNDQDNGEVTRDLSVIHCMSDGSVGRQSQRSRNIPVPRDSVIHISGDDTHASTSQGMDEVDNIRQHISTHETNKESDPLNTQPNSIPQLIQAAKTYLDPLVSPQTSTTIQDEKTNERSQSKPQKSRVMSPAYKTRSYSRVQVPFCEQQTLTSSDVNIQYIESLISQASTSNTAHASSCTASTSVHIAPYDTSTKSSSPSSMQRWKTNDNLDSPQFSSDQSSNEKFSYVSNYKTKISSNLSPQKQSPMNGPTKQSHTSSPKPHIHRPWLCSPENQHETTNTTNTTTSKQKPMTSQKSYTSSHFTSHEIYQDNQPENIFSPHGRGFHQNTTRPTSSTIVTPTSSAMHPQHTSHTTATTTSSSHQHHHQQQRQYLHNQPHQSTSTSTATSKSCFPSFVGRENKRRSDGDSSLRLSHPSFPSPPPSPPRQPPPSQQPQPQPSSSSTSFSSNLPENQPTPEQFHVASPRIVISSTSSIRSLLHKQQTITPKSKFSQSESRSDFIQSSPSQSALPNQYQRKSTMTSSSSSSFTSSTYQGQGHPGAFTPKTANKRQSAVTRLDFGASTSGRFSIMTDEEVTRISDSKRGHTPDRKGETTAGGVGGSDGKAEVKDKPATRKRKAKDEVDIRIEVTHLKGDNHHHNNGPILEERQRLKTCIQERQEELTQRQCECAKAESEILISAVKLFGTSTDIDLSKLEDLSELHKDNEVIVDSLDLAASIRALCNHGRRVNDVFPGSVVLRVKCPTLTSLYDLCDLHSTGHLQKALSTMLGFERIVARFLRGFLALKVTLDARSLRTCEKFLFTKIQNTSRPLPSRRTPTKRSNVRRTPDRRVVRSTENLLSSPTLVSPSLSVHERSVSTPVLPIKSPLTSPLTCRSPLSTTNGSATGFWRERKFSFGETTLTRIAFQELNLSDAESPISPCLSASSLKEDPVLFSPEVTKRLFSSSPMISPRRRPSPSTSPIPSPRRLKRCDVIREQENFDH